MLNRADSPEAAAFRLEVRAWLAANLPDDIRDTTLRPPPAKLMEWHRLVYARGWAAPHWPKEHGGMGASLNTQLVLIEEMARAGAPPLFAPSINFLAPALMEFGTAAQRARFLPAILKGEILWSQCYSEPGAGSDLASLTTSALRDGDHYVVNGQKIWNTWSHYADWTFALVRTDAQAKPKHAGISMLLIDLRTPGITIRGIDTIAGDDELATVFYDDVRVPAENLLGPLNAGWKVANHVLSYERFGQAIPLNNTIALERIKKVARASGMIEDAGFRDRLAKAEIEILCIASLFNHAVAIHNQGRVLGPDSSIMKIVATETLQRLTDLLIEAAGAAGADAGMIETSEGPVDVTTMFLVHRRATIFGGSSEIQRNVIAKRVLDLPG